VGDGRNRVDLTYVDNVVHAVLLALEPAVAPGGTYTITNDEPAVLWDVIRRVLAHTGLNPRLRVLPFPAAVAAALVMEGRARLSGAEPLLTRYSVAILARTQTYDVSAARRDLGYEPIVPFAAGWADTIVWFREHWLPTFRATRQGGVVGLSAGTQFKIDVQASGTGAGDGGGGAAAAAAATGVADGAAEVADATPEAGGRGASRRVRK
jgi:hypothetical protein